MEKYTVIIPTRDRAETLEATLRTCLRQTYGNFEIIVSDNCSNDNTYEIVTGFKDPRIRYIKTDRRLSMSGNFDFSLQHVDDGFVMFIGDDDGLMPDAVNYVSEVVERYKVLAVTSSPAVYLWPSFVDKSRAGSLSYNSFKDVVEIRRPDKWIRKTLAFECHYCSDLPNLYYGFVHKEIINKGCKDGIYFRSITPDAYSAFASALFLKEYAYSNRSFVLPAMSAKSNGASQLQSKGNSNESEKYLSENDIPLAAGFVFCPSIEVVLAETFAKLAETFPEKCAEYRIDYRKMLENSLAGRNPRTAEAVISAVKQMQANFNIEISDNFYQSYARRRFINKFQYVFPVVDALFRRNGKIMRVPDSARFGVRDIDDAVMFTHALRSFYEHPKEFWTVGRCILNAIELYRQSNVRR